MSKTAGDNVFTIYHFGSNRFCWRCHQHSLSEAAGQCHELHSRGHTNRSSASMKSVCMKTIQKYLGRTSEIQIDYKYNDNHCKKIIGLSKSIVGHAVGMTDIWCCHRRHRRRRRRRRRHRRRHRRHRRRHRRHCRRHRRRHRRHLQN